MPRAALALPFGSRLPERPSRNVVTAGIEVYENLPRIDVHGVATSVRVPCGFLPSTPIRVVQMLLDRLDGRPDAIGPLPHASGLARANPPRSPQAPRRHRTQDCPRVDELERHTVRKHQPRELRPRRLSQPLSAPSYRSLHLKVTKHRLVDHDADRKRCL